MSLKQLEKILYFEAYVVLEPGSTPLKEKELLAEEKYREVVDQYGSQAFKVGIGAEAIRELLQKVDIEALWSERHDKVKSTTEFFPVRRSEYASHRKTPHRVVFQIEHRRFPRLDPPN